MECNTALTAVLNRLWLSPETRIALYSLSLDLIFKIDHRSMQLDPLLDQTATDNVCRLREMIFFTVQSNGRDPLFFFFWGGSYFFFFFFFILKTATVIVVALLLYAVFVGFSIPQSFGFVFVFFCYYYLWIVHTDRLLGLLLCKDGSGVFNVLSA